MKGRVHVVEHAPRDVPGVVDGRGKFHRLLAGFRGSIVPSDCPLDEAQQVPGAGQAGAVTRGFQGLGQRSDVGDRAFHLAQRALGPAHQDVADELRSCFEAPIFCGLGTFECLVDCSSRGIEVALLDRGLGIFCEQLELERRPGRENLRGSPQEARGRRDVAAVERPPASGGKLRCGAIADVPRVLVYDADLAPVPVGLLQVVAQDLFELQLASALAVDAFGPSHELLVNVGADALEEASVGGVPDDLMAEAVEHLLVFQLADELLGRQDIEIRSQAWTNGSSTSSVIASSANVRPMTDAGSTTARSSARSASRREATSA